MRADINGFSLCPECKGKVVMDPGSAEKCVVCEGDGVLFERKRIQADMAPSESLSLLISPCCKYARVGRLAKAAQRISQFLMAQKQREEAKQSMEEADQFIREHFPGT